MTVTSKSTQITCDMNPTQQAPLAHAVNESTTFLTDISLFPLMNCISGVNKIERRIRKLFSFTRIHHISSV